MASFDVSSLFTNIPLNETIDLCTDLIFDESDSFDFSDCTFKRVGFKNYFVWQLQRIISSLMGACMIRLMV